MTLVKALLPILFGTEAYYAKCDAISYQEWHRNWGIADRMLFDAKAPKGSELPGGNGVSFDWSLLESLDQGVEYMLSGGLNAQNVCEAIKNTHAIGMDVSSGIEIKPGVKDKELMDGFFNAIKSCS